MAKKRYKKHMRNRIHGLWWTNLLTLKVKYPKRWRYSRSHRQAFSDGVAAGVTAMLNNMEVASDAVLEEPSKGDL